MTAGPYPVLEPVSIDRLRPTQITVGMREVKEKCRRWHELPKEKKDEFLGRHMVPAIFGPKERYYVVDHHHLARALHEEGAKQVLVSVVADLRMLERVAFWVFLDCSATIWMEALRRTGRPIWRSRRGDDCRAATVTEAIFS